MKAPSIGYNIETKNFRQNFVSLIGYSDKCLHSIFHPLYTNKKRTLEKCLCIIQIVDGDPEPPRSINFIK